MAEIVPGLAIYPAYFSNKMQQDLLIEIRRAVARAPLFQPVMPRTGKELSVRMTNFGPLGWVADRQGYRYQPLHPLTGVSWPEMPAILTRLWHELAAYPQSAEACLVNFYQTTSRMGLHQDRDEAAITAPVISVSLGDSAIFRFGGTERGGKTQSLKLASGDVLVMSGPSRLRFHGVDRIIAGSSQLLAKGGRINLTLRRVTV